MTSVVCSFFFIFRPLSPNVFSNIISIYSYRFISKLAITIYTYTQVRVSFLWTPVFVPYYRSTIMILYYLLYETCCNEYTEFKRIAIKRKKQSLRISWMSMTGARWCTGKHDDYLVGYGVFFIFLVSDFIDVTTMFFFFLRTLFRDSKITPIFTRSLRKYSW